MDSAMEELGKKVGGCFAESMGSVFSMLTGRDFAITPKEGVLVDHAGITALYDGPAVYAKVQYTKGMTGPMLFAMPLREGTMLVDLMLGGDGAPSEELAGDSKDALAETINQSMGSANQALSDMAGETLSISNVEIHASTEAGQSMLEELLGPGPFFDLPLETTQESLQALIHVLIPDLLSEQMKRKLGFGEVAAPPPPPEPVGAPEPVVSQAPAPAAAPRAAAGSSAPMGAPVDTGNLDLLLDIELPLMVRMGQTEMPLGDLLKLTPGSILELNRAADAPVELLVNGKQIAKGEVVVVDGNFAFRITEIESTANRLRSLA
ncbi:flagellar motor switch protein FliN [Holophaga foetida]|uniref:flagellar motor switch protein FliN n=1 Tax=Holophaga foetida TaxID=35839 RepID=UPI0002473EE0|nr:flagellar motor switch protein FliN [Holophaga foetida]